MQPNMNTICLFEQQGWTHVLMIEHGLLSKTGEPQQRMLDMLRESGWTDDLMLQHGVAHIAASETPEQQARAAQYDQQPQQEQPEEAATGRINVDEKVDRFIELRDSIKQLKDDLKEKTSGLEEEQEHIASELGAFLSDTGQESGRAKHGTFFWTTKNSVRMDDHAQFLKWLVGGVVHELGKAGCIAQGKQAEDCVTAGVKAASLAFLTKAVQKEMVASYIEEKGTPPPGVNWETEREVQVRRATSKK